MLSILTLFVIFLSSAIATDLEILTTSSTPVVPVMFPPTFPKNLVLSVDIVDTPYPMLYLTTGTTYTSKCRGVAMDTTTYVASGVQVIVADGCKYFDTVLDECVGTSCENARVAYGGLSSFEVHLKRNSTTAEQVVNTSMMTALCILKQFCLWIKNNAVYGFSTL